MTSQEAKSQQGQLVGVMPWPLMNIGQSQSEALIGLLCHCWIVDTSDSETHKDYEGFLRTLVKWKWGVYSLYDQNAQENMLLLLLSLTDTVMDCEPVGGDTDKDCELTNWLANRQFGPWFTPVGS